MCGIAGLADLSGASRTFAHIARSMADALVHRGPDEDGYFDRPGLSFAARRLSIVGVSNGRQPAANESGEIQVVFNGELYDYAEMRAELEGRGHRLRTRCDTELLPHLWEEFGGDMFARLRGQFALALWDGRDRRLVLARDRMGICPLYWTRQKTQRGDLLIFASEIKALLRSGLVEPRANLRGIDQTFTFFALPGPETCFEGVQALLPGHYLDVSFARAGETAAISDHTYWEIDFPDRGAESAGDLTELIDTYDALVHRAVRRRLKADVPIVSYLSGGLDSSLVLKLASDCQGTPLPAFTIQVQADGLDESAKAAEACAAVGARASVLTCTMDDIVGAYPRLIEAAECPVSDTCCAALLMLAGEVHRQGFKVALTGEGADETLAGYPWFKLHKVLSVLDAIPGAGVGEAARRAGVRLAGLRNFSPAYRRRIEAAVGGPNAWLSLYNVVSLSKIEAYGPRLRPLLETYIAYSDLGLNHTRMAAWHPFNRSLYLGQRIHLSGLLLSTGGDRVAMQSSVETRYPFLDEDVVEFLARLAPQLKLRGFTEKFLLRRLAARHLPRAIAWRPKAMFRTPWDMFGAGKRPAFLEQALSHRALDETGYFDIPAVRSWRAEVAAPQRAGPRRRLVEHGLANVVSTQLWHHAFISDLGLDMPRVDLGRASEPMQVGLQPN